MRFTGSPLGRRMLDNWEHLRRAVREGDADRLQARAAGAPRRGAPAAPGRSPSSAEASRDGQADRLHRVAARSLPQKRAGRRAPARLARGRRRTADAEPSRRSRPGAAWTAACRSARRAVRSATRSPTSHDLGVPRSLAATRTAGSPRPTTSPSSPGGCARRRARPRACSAIDSAPVTIEPIEKAIAERAFAEGWVAPRPPRARTGKRVAIVGSGPAGLAAAAQLNRAGHTRRSCTRRRARPGGLLRYGIPDFKMEKSVIDRRLAILAAEGIELRCGVARRRDPTWDAAARRARRGRDRDRRAARRAISTCPGRELAGVVLAMDYLTEQNQVVGGERASARATTSAASAS